MADAVNLGDEPYLGGCHCGAVRFRFRAPAALEILACNCSICNLTGFLHVTVPHSAFVLLTPLDALSDYRFGSGAAAHLFCRVCGIKREPLDFKIDEIWPRPVEFSLRFFKPDRLLAACRLPAHLRRKPDRLPGNGVGAAVVGDRGCESN